VAGLTFSLKNVNINFLLSKGRGDQCAMKPRKVLLKDDESSLPIKDKIFLLFRLEESTFLSSPDAPDWDSLPKKCWML
jgi:hypothetical protein